MSRLIRASSARRVLHALRELCTEARGTDRELMAMRTNLSRQSGWGCGSAQS
jgi:hypothetical protein